MSGNVVIYGMKNHATCHISDKKGVIVERDHKKIILPFCEESLTCVSNNFTILKKIVIFDLL
jgi:hypothetical protein